jgi:uncharacterized protein
MAVAGRMCRVLKERPGTILDTVGEANIRFAALLHDTGHGPFSHTSEQYFSSSNEIAELKADGLYEHSDAGEILSSLIIRSKALRQFVAEINKVFKQDIDCDQIDRMVTGRMPDDKMFLSEFIHGPFDADKLDYMHRDGRFSGLRMHVDLDRLFASIDVMTATAHDKTMRRLVGSMTGTAPLTQIMFNKMLLFTGIYHHHKVRAVDCMLWAVFQLATQTGATLGGVKIESPWDFLRLTDDRVLLPELTDNADIRRIVEAIRNRALWKRALVISRRTVPPEMHEAAAGSTNRGLFTGLVQLAPHEQPHIKRRRELADEIWERAGKPGARHEVWLDIPRLPAMNEAKQMWIMSPGQDYPDTLGEFIPIAQWVELYGTHKWQAHVFCPPEHGPAVNKASRDVLGERFGLAFNKFATRYAHLPE